MIFKKVDLKEFETHKFYYFDQIPKAQNSDLKYTAEIFDYYHKALQESEKNFQVVALFEGDIIGCAFFRFYDQEQHFFLINVNTKKEFQHTNKKVATNLLRFGLKDFFKTHDRIFLWVRKDNLVAQKLYKKLGFEKTDYYPNNLDFLKNEEDINVIMELGKATFESVLNAEYVTFYF